MLSFKEWLEESERESYLTEEQFKDVFSMYGVGFFEKELQQSEVKKIKALLKEQGLNIGTSTIREIKYNPSLEVYHKFKEFLKNSYYEPYLIFVYSNKEWDLAINKKTYAKELTKNKYKNCEERYSNAKYVFAVRDDKF